MSLKYTFSIFVIVLIFFILSVVTFILIATRSSEIQSELITRDTLLAQKILPDLVSDLGDYYFYAYPTYVNFTKTILSTYPDIIRYNVCKHTDYKTL